jgi:uncharacterized membrane protein
MKLVPLHVIAAAIALVSGFIALYAFKGRTLHRKSGTLFAYAMLVMSLSGAVMAVGRASAAINIPVALVTAYLVITSLATVRPPSSRSRRLDRTAMVAAFAFGAGSLLVAISGGARGRTAFPLVMLGVLALFAGEGDRRMMRAGGLKGAARLRRHLWRMCTALFVAAGSFFLGPVRRIPEPLRLPAFRLIPLVVLVTMVYWLWRYRRKRSSQNVIGASPTEAHAERERRLVGTSEAI